jgi:DNA-binding GntR family transcriptional regulator
VTIPKFPWSPESPINPEQEQSLAQRVRQEVLRMIMHGEIRAGQRLSEPDIAKRLGVSRVPVREALRSLEPTGLVTTRINAGVFVRKLSPTEINELYQIRGLLDAHAARFACNLPAKEHKALVKKLEGSVKVMQKAEANGNTPLYYQENLSFHWEAIKSCKIGKLAEIYQSITQQLHLCRASNLSGRESRSASLVEHEALFNAIAAGNSQLAEQAAYDHANRALKRLENP